MQAIGLPLEEAMRFWRTEFEPKCRGDAFDKKYAYNVRYNYGREGRKSEYTPYSCLKIISSQPGKVGALSFTPSLSMHQHVLLLLAWSCS